MSLDFKKILGEELVKKLDEHSLTSEIVERLGGAKLIQNDEGKFIPEEKFNEKVSAKNKQIEQLQAELEQRDEDMAELENKIKSGGNAAEELEKLKAKHKEDTEALREQVKETRIKSKIGLALMAQKIKQREWADILTDKIYSEYKDKFVELEDGRISGLDDAVKAKKESDTFKEWFGEIRLNGEPPTDSKEKELKTKQQQAVEEAKTQYEEALKDKGPMHVDTLAAQRRLHETSKAARLGE